MRKIHVSALAESDLISIWLYTFQEWGEIHADKYLDQLDRGIRKLADNPERGVGRDNVREGYRVLFVGSHAGYYNATSDVVHVVRVLHGCMDPDRHLE
jgi:toxin ParE1/3/4